MVATNPMQDLWFSIFIGWLCKLLIVKLGGAKLYQRARPVFLGLIVGDCVASGIWLAVSIVLAAQHLPYRAVISCRCKERRSGIMKPVKVAADHWNFETAPGQYITPLGGNILNDRHPGQGTLFENFDAQDCDRRFGIMAELGLNCLRQAIGVNSVFHPSEGLLSKGMKNWDMFIALAKKHGIYLMPVGGYIGGNDWFDVERLADSGKALDESCAFWQSFCSYYAGHPAIWAWDLRNELLYETRPHMTTPGSPQERQIESMLKSDWPGWLECRYGSVAAMNKAYGNAGHSSFADVPGSVHFIEKQFDLCASDFRHYLNDRGYDWCKRQCDVIRAAAPGHMIVSGNNAWMSPDQDLWLANGFHNRALHDLFDFITFHPYPALQAKAGGRGDPLDHLERRGEPLQYWLHSCIGNARMDYYGKPVVVQEFGWYGGGESSFIGPLPFRTEQQHADYTRILVDALLPHTNGFINWPTFDMPAANDISNHGGIFTHDGKPKELSKVYRELASLSSKRMIRAKGTTSIQYSLLGLYTSRPYQDRFWDEVHEVLSSGQIPDIKFI